MANIRFQDATSDVVQLVQIVVAEHFNDLINIKIKVLFDLKKRKSGDKYVLARIQKSNDLLRLLTIDENGADEGADYFLFLDLMVFGQVNEDDRKRIIRHELRHCFVDAESGECKILPHEIEDFYAEVELNQDDLRWRERVGECAKVWYGDVDEDMAMDLSNVSNATPKVEPESTEEEPSSISSMVSS